MQTMTTIKEEINRLHMETTDSQFLLVICLTTVWVVSAFLWIASLTERKEPTT